MKAKSQESAAILSRGFRIFNTVFCILVFIIVAYPLYYVIIASFSDPMQVSAGRVAFWPNGFTLKGYEMVFAERDLWIGYRNTIFYTLVGTLINITVTFPGRLRGIAQGVHAPQGDYADVRVHHVLQRRPDSHLHAHAQPEHDQHRMGVSHPLFAQRV